MKRFTSLVAAAAIAASLGLTGAAASAQAYPPYPVPVYASWQAAWDNYQYDRHHVVLGIVAGFRPYRLEIRHNDGMIQNVDLKNGTVILPTGATPMPGERVALVGYWSAGTFIVNQLVIRT